MIEATRRGCHPDTRPQCAAACTGVNMAVLQGTFPALVILGMAIIFGAAITGVQVMGIVVTFCGVAIIASKGELRTLMEFTFNRGDVLMLIATMIFAGYTIALRDRPHSVDLPRARKAAAGRDRPPLRRPRPRKGDDPPDLPRREARGLKKKQPAADPSFE